MINMIDNVQAPHMDPMNKHTGEPVTIVKIGGPEVGQESPLTHAGDDINRFKQIVDLHNGEEECGEYANSPNEKVASVDSVTIHAGGGLNGPKDPHDLRGNSFPIYKGE